MAAILSLLVVLTLVVVITRVATTALTLTGLSREAARFQARSALTGAGFTTQESERVVNHPVRRKIIMWLMFLGNAGFATAAGSLVLTFLAIEQSDAVVLKVGLLLAGLGALLFAAKSRWLDRQMTRVIGAALKRYTHLDTRDYVSLLHLTGDFRVIELAVDRDDWIAGKTLAEIALRNEGVLVLGVERADGTYRGAPKGPTRLEAGDTILVYGRAPALERLDERRRGSEGDREHDRACAEQARLREQEIEQDPVEETAA